MPLGGQCALGSVSKPILLRPAIHSLRLGPTRIRVINGDRPRLKPNSGPCRRLASVSPSSRRIVLKQSLGERTAQTTTAVDDLATALGLHARPEADLAPLLGGVSNSNVHDRSSGARSGPNGGCSPQRALRQALEPVPLRNGVRAKGRSRSPRRPEDSRIRPWNSDGVPAAARSTQPPRSLASESSAPARHAWVGPAWSTSAPSAAG